MIARVGAHLNLAQLRRQTEERITGILNSIGGGFHAVDKNWRFVAFNKAAERMFKQRLLNTDSLLGKHIFQDAFPEARGTATFVAAERIMNERVETTVESLYEPWQRWYLVRHYPTDDGGVATFFEDITDRKQAERNAEVVAQSVALQDLSRRITKLQDDERRHIARELHDSAGQTLAALGMTLANIEHRCRNGDAQLGAFLNEAKEMVRDLTQEIRTTSYLLHPPLLDESGIAVALKMYLEGLAQRSNLRIEFNISEQIRRLPRELELVVFRVVQESLTNIHRHSGSKTRPFGLSAMKDRYPSPCEIRAKGFRRANCGRFNREVLAWGFGGCAIALGS